jgi:pimeloyl-ACP methyl ester carboxylesterase
MDLTAFLARIDAPEVYWIGTSMGGLLGMILASLKNTPIRKLILNDVGPLVPASVIQRLLSYAGVQILMPTFELMEEKLREIYSNFGRIDEEHWQMMLKHSICQTPEGAYTLTCDPMVTSQFSEAPQNKPYEDEEGNLTVWHYWEKITCPVYVIHGEKSDLLTTSILNKMSQGPGPKFDYYGVADAGHAPWLIKPSICQQILKRGLMLSISYLINLWG